MNSKDWILISGGECNTPPPKKRERERERERESLKMGYLSKSFCGANFIINIIKVVFRKLVKTLDI